MIFAAKGLKEECKDPEKRR